MVKAVRLWTMASNLNRTSSFFLQTWVILLHLLWLEAVWPCTTDALLGQAAVHPLSRLDRPAVTHHTVKPWAGVFEMWQHNQFPWFMVTPKRRMCWVTRQLKKESRRGNADDSNHQMITAEGAHLLSLAATIRTILQATWPHCETLLTPVGGFICFAISLQIRVCTCGTRLLQLIFSTMMMMIITFFIIIIVSLLLRVPSFLFLCLQSSNIFLHHSNSFAIADHWVKKWSGDFLPLWECNFKQQFFTSDAAKVHLEGILRLSSA